MSYIKSLLVVSVVESAVGNSHVGFHIVSVGVLFVTFQESEGCNEVPLFQEMTPIWQLKFFLLQE